MTSEAKSRRAKKSQDKKKNANENFSAKVKEKLTEETLEVAWVLPVVKCGTKKFELRLNRCTQFPRGYYELVSANDAKEAKYMLYEKLIQSLV
jgi:hypothetical protein